MLHHGKDLQDCAHVYEGQKPWPEGEINVFDLRAPGIFTPRVKPMRSAVATIGGLLFGAGFGVAGYCPGAVAMGQGDLDAVCSVLGLTAASFLTSEVSRGLGKAVMSAMLGTIARRCVLQEAGG